jgi:thiamine-phosphate pyrophosphorylase
MASRPKSAHPRPAPRLYLITPRLADPSAFTAPLAAALAVADVAAVLLRLADADEGTLIKRAKAVAAPVQERDAALLLDGRPDLVARARADGAHMTGIAAFAEAVGALKPNGIVGAGGLATRHDAMLAADQGADYVLFGEPDADGAGPGFTAVEERISWWAELFEAPCVGYAASRAEVKPLVGAGADFVALGDWLWADAATLPATLAEIAQDLRLPEAIA